jgi:hypothetical protein
MICKVPVPSTKLKVKCIVRYVMVKATPWTDTRNDQREIQECVMSRVGIVG